MKSYIFLTAIVATFATLIGCTDDLAVDFETQSRINYRGEPVDAFLDITVGALSVSMGTRADEPYTGEEDDYDPYEDTEAERWVNDLWVFQYDNDESNSSYHTLIADPIYLSEEITSQEVLKNLPVTLSDNEGNPSLIYVVTNTGDKDWASNEADFATVEKLLAAALPSHEPIFVTSTTKKGDLSIPMEGNSGEVNVAEGKVIIVPVTRTYAKIMIADPYLDMEAWTNGEQGTIGQTIESAEVYSVSIGNIPLYCQVGTIAPANWDGKEAPTYPESANVQWISRAFSSTLAEGTDPGIVQPDKGTDGSSTYYPYVMYLPENLQGQAGTEGTSKLAQEEMAPPRALEINVVIACTDDQGGTTNYPYTFYPGADVYTDYNIKRNCVYRVKINISELSYERVPSANCLVALEGETIAFFPYYRVETGGGYDFTDYLDPNGKTGADDDTSVSSGYKIDHVDIVWQTKDCIGDNSGGSLVYLHPNTDEHTGYERIYVKAQKEGNALIAAYDKANNIIWSWHIWVRSVANGDPTHPANALVYYTYEWDNDTIYNYFYKPKRQRVAGYQIMTCNLGALQDEPNYNANKFFGHHFNDPEPSNGDEDLRSIQYFQAGDGIVRTFGMLYQWGRKDPFPPLTTTKGYITSINEDGFNTGYYVHDYNDDHTEQLYGNDNTTKVHKTSYDENGPTYTGAPTIDDGQGYLFHSHIHNATTDGGGVAYSIKHPTVFLCGVKEIAKGINDNATTSKADNTEHVSAIGNYAFTGCGWSEEDHDNKEWGALEPDDSQAHLTLLIKDAQGDPIVIYDDYEDVSKGGSKSIFDPCPYGWRVGSGDLWLGFTKNGVNTLRPYWSEEIDDYGTMDNVNYNPEKSCLLGLTMYMGEETNGWRNEVECPTSWFPAQGYLLADGTGYRVGGCGNYVNANTASTAHYDRVNIMHIHDRIQNFKQFETLFRYTVKSTGNPLRCVRDTK